MSTSVSSVVSHFPSAEDGFTTTTSSSTASGATTVGLNTVAGYTNGETVVLVIEPTDSNAKQVFTGVVDTSGVQITSVVWTAGTDQTHALGSTVVDYETATHWRMMTKGILVEHAQDGRHTDITANTIVIADAGTLDVDTINEATIANGVTVDGMSIKDGAVVGASGKGVLNSSLGTGSGELGAAWQSWTPTFVNLSGGTLDYAKYTQIGKTVHYKIMYTLGGAGVSGGITFTYPVTDANGDVNAPMGEATLVDTGTAAYFGKVLGSNTTKGLIRVVTTSSSYAGNSGLSSTVPFTWASGDIIFIKGTYEAA